MFGQRPPRRDLIPIAAALWTYRGDGRDGGASFHAPGGDLIVPADGCADVIWDGAVVRVGAPTVRPVTVPAAGAQTGLRLRPGAIAALTGGSRRPAAEVVAERLEAMGAATVLTQAETPLDGLEALLARLLEARPPNVHALALTAALARPPGDVDALARRLDLPARTLRRRIGAALEVGPKEALRILRFQRFLRLRDRLPALPLAALADGLGYADQAHMTREVRAFSGLTPATVAWSRSWPFCSRRGDRRGAGWAEPSLEESLPWTSASP